MSIIKQRRYSLNKTLKCNLIQLCRNNNISYKDNNNKRIKKKYIIDNILKNEFGINEFNKLNEINTNLVDKEVRENRLKLYTNNELKEILRNYNLVTNGMKKYLIDRIVNYEYNNKIIKLREQQANEFYINLTNLEIKNNILHIPEKLNINDTRIYDINIVYEPTYFANIIEYLKHLENLRYLNYDYLIQLHLELATEINTNLYDSIVYYLGLLGWVSNDNSYVESVEDYVNNKYKIKENNIKIAEKIEIIDNICDNCTICLCNIEEQEKCKKLPCGHIFHSGCINNWLNVELKCPICRFEII